MAINSGPAHYDGPLAVATYDVFTGGGLLSSGGVLAGDVAFYLECARRFGGPILELGAGTGRVLIPLAEAGYDIVGVDLSPAMLALAAAKVEGLSATAGRVRLVAGDMRDFAIAQRFALVLIPARAFQFLLDPQDQRAALDCIRRHLVPGGHLVVDLFDPNFELLLSPDFKNSLTREVEDPGSGHRLRRTVVSRDVDKLRQIGHETLRIEELDGSGAVVASEDTSWSLRWTTRQELAYLFELCGFEPVEQYSDFKGSAPAYGREQLWVARAVSPSPARPG